MDESGDIIDLSPMFSKGSTSIHMKSEHKAIVDHILGGVVTPNREARLASDQEFFSNFNRISIKDISPVETGGVVVYSDKVNAYVDRSDGHILVTGASGSLKSTFVAIPTIMAQARAGENLIIADCKGELYDSTRWIFEALGYDIIKKIDLREPEESVSWNPLLKPYNMYRSGDAKQVSVATELVENYANILSPTGSFEDPFWDEAGAEVLKGAMILLFRICDDPEEVTIRNLMAIFSYMIGHREEFDEFYKLLGPLDNVRTYMDVYYENAEKTGSCIIQTARKALIPFATNEYISSVLVDDAIDFKSMVEKKAVIFICVPDEKTAYHSIVSMFVQQMYMALVDYASAYPGGRLPNRFNIILDEFASFPKLSNIDAMVSACRSRNIRFMFIVQALSQVRSRYGEDGLKIILGNCSINYFLNSHETDMLSYYSYLCGQGKDGKPLLDAYRLQRLSKENGEALILFDREHPYITNLVRFSEWAGPPEDWVPTDLRHPIHSLKTVDVQSGIKKLRRMYNQGYDPSDMYKDEPVEEDEDLFIPCVGSNFNEQMFFKAVYDALDNVDDVTDSNALSYEMLGEFIFLRDKKKDLLDFLISMEEEIELGTPTIFAAYKEAINKIASLDQEGIDSIRRKILQ